MTATPEGVGGAGRPGPAAIARGTDAMGRVVRDLLLTAEHAALWIRTPWPDGAGLHGMCAGLDRPALASRVLLDAPAAYAGGPARLPWGDTVDVRVTGRPRRPGGRSADALVLDGSVLVTRSPHDAAEPYLMVTAGSGLTDLVQSMFDTAWPEARPLGPDPAGSDPLDDGLKRRILRRLADGSKDEAIARALGVSLRTCRRHIAEILLDADAVSRFQAGYRLGRDGFTSGR